MKQKKIIEPGVVDRLANERILSRLTWVTLQPQVILVMGRGIGLSVAGLRDRYSNATILAMDHESIQSLDDAAHRVQAEGLHLPFANHSVNLIFSNLFMPWCHNLLALFQEWRRVLHPSGLLIFTSLGPDTLREVQGKMIPDFLDMHHVGDMLVQSGWQDPVLDIEYVTLKYKENAGLTQELFQTSMIESVIDLKNVLAVTYEIVYGLAWAPIVPMGYGADESGVVKIPLASLRGRGKY